MIIFVDNYLEILDNVIFNSCNFVQEKKIKTGHKIGYMSILDNFLYFRTPSSGIQMDCEKTKRYDISDPLNPVISNDFEVKNYVASHNLYFFKDKQNNIKCIGGQHRGIRNIQVINPNKFFPEYHKSTPLVNSYINFTSSVMKSYFMKIYDSSKPCPYYANGLHLFELKDNKTICLNNNMPILNGLNEGRCDGFYGPYDIERKSLQKSYGGISVFDSMASVVYDKENDMYFLYQRANLLPGCRSIQYCTSKDLLKWSPFKLISFGPNFDYFQTNVYYSNFFKVDDTNFTVGILPFTYPNGSSNLLEKTNNLIKKDSDVIIPSLDNIIKNDGNYCQNPTIHSNRLLLARLVQNRTTIKSLGKTPILKRGSNVNTKVNKNNKIVKPKPVIKIQDTNVILYWSLVYSFDYCNFKYMGTVLKLPSDVHSHPSSCNHPYIFNNKMYFYVNLNDTDTLIIYSLGKNRFSYITNEGKRHANVRTKLIHFENEIFINFSKIDSGSLKIQLLDKDNNILPGFSFDDFDPVTSNDSIEYKLSWKNVSVLPLANVKLEIQLLNANIYSLNGNMV